MIRPLQPAEAGWAAGLHARLMARSVLALFGPGPLRILYEELARSPHGLALAAEEGGRLEGVIAVMADRAAFARSLLLRRGPALAARMAWGALTRSACRRLLLRLPRYWGAARAGTAAAEMLFIAVEPDARDRGLARRLIEAVLADLRRRGVARVAVSVDAEHPRIGGLLRRLGFAPEARLPFAEKDHEVLALDLIPGAATGFAPAVAAARPAREGSR
jgi:ribosomal protein S18 acetylase RimI-like enzyme